MPSHRVTIEFFWTSVATGLLADSGDVRGLPEGAKDAWAANAGVDMTVTE